MSKILATIIICIILLSCEEMDGDFIVKRVDLEASFTIDDEICKDDEKKFTSDFIKIETKTSVLGNSGLFSTIEYKNVEIAQINIRFEPRAGNLADEISVNLDVNGITSTVTTNQISSINASEPMYEQVEDILQSILLNDQNTTLKTVVEVCTTGDDDKLVDGWVVIQYSYRVSYKET